MRHSWIIVLAACGPTHHDGDCDPSDPSCNNADAGPADTCPAVRFTAMPTTPTIELLIDQSLSMSSTFGTTTRYKSVQDALVAPGTGVVSELESKAYFGATLFTSALTCPALQIAPRAINNSAAIAALIAANGPGLYTPTGDAITAVIADFAANPPPAGSPPFIVLATDGIPNTCANPFDETNGSIMAVAAAQAAFAAGIKLVVLSVGPDTSIPNLQAMANAGAGVQMGQPDAPFYKGDNPQQLADSFQQIIGGVLSCDLTLSGQVDPQSAMSGTVTLNGVTLVYGTDWIIVNGTTIEIVGAACMQLQNATNPTVVATFPCGAVIL